MNAADPARRRSRPRRGQPVEQADTEVALLMWGLLVLYLTGHRRHHRPVRLTETGCRAAIALVLVGALAGCSYANPGTRRSAPPPRHHAVLVDDGYLRGVHGRLVDSSGRPVKLAGVSWFGLETGSCALHGLSMRSLRDMLSQMRGVGFNVLRIPFSNQFLDDPTCTPTGIDYNLNPELRGLQGLALLDQIVDEAGRSGLKVILDRHSPTVGVRGDLWYTQQVPQSRWISDWVMLAHHYLGNRTVIAADINNEPHGAATWGDGNPATDWRLAAETAGNAVLAANPHWLILVEGIQYYRGDQYWWGGQLLGAAQYPVRLSRPDKLVYSPHDYGPAVSPQAWFYAPDFPRNLPNVWDKHWGGLMQQGTPVLIGEFSGRSLGKDVQGTWQRSLMAYLDQRGFGYMYWSWNPDSSDTEGMLQADWMTINQPELEAVLGSHARLAAGGPAARPRVSPSPSLSPPPSPCTGSGHPKGTGGQ
jgi:endoglucanase